MAKGDAIAGLLRVARRAGFGTLSSRFLLIALGLSTASCLVIFPAFELIAYRSLRADLLSKIEQTADINSEVLATPFWQLDVDAIEAAVTAMLRDTDIAAVIARDSEGAVLASRRVVDPAANETVKIERAVVFAQHGRSVEVGILEIYFTEHRVQLLMTKRLLFDLSLFTALMMAIGLSVLVAVRRSVGVPLGRLTASILEGKTRRQRRPVDWSSPDELGILIREYNDLLALQAAAETEMHQKSTLLEATLQSIRQGVMVFDPQQTVAAFNARYLELHGLPEGSLSLGTPLEELVRAQHEDGQTDERALEALVADRMAVARSGRRFRQERTTASGRVLEEESNPMPNGGSVSTYSDVTERREYEERLQQLALTDSLTGLPNRSLFQDRLGLAAAASRLSGRLAAVLIVDLDRFKDLNDALGHEAGDQIIREVASRLSKAVGDTDTVARLGGDELGAILTELEDAEDAASGAQRLLALLDQPVQLGERALRVSASIGIAVAPLDGRDPDALMKCADLALYAAKAEGRNRYRFFLPEMDERVKERLRLEEDLHRAVHEGQFTLHFQPLLSLDSGRVVGGEALLRWQHPERGLLQADAFIEQAEESGVLLGLSPWLFGQACAAAASWRRWGLGDLRVAVNASAAHLRRDDLVEIIRRALADSGLEAHCLELEITESVLMSDVDRSVTVLRQLRELGVRIAVDDFGTGYSSLSYLRRLPIDTLKIDRSFVHDLPLDADAGAVVQAISGLGRSLGLLLVAEGVETEAQHAFLRGIGCHEVQGFLFSRALPGAALENWVRNR